MSDADVLGIHVGDPCFSVDEEFEGCTGVVATSGAVHCDGCIQRVADTITDMATEAALDSARAAADSED